MALEPTGAGHFKPQRSIARCVAIWIGITLLAGVAAGQERDRGAQDTAIFVVTARNLVGQSVRNTSGSRAGEVRYVLVRLDGAVRGLALRPEEPKDDKLTIVPWGAIDVEKVDEELRVTTDASQVMSAPRFSRDEIAKLTRPAEWVTVSEYWAPIEKSVAAQGSDETTQRKSSEQAGKGSADREQRGAESGGNELSELPLPHILVGRATLYTIADPEFKFARQLRGSDLERLYERFGARVDWRS